MTPGPTPDQITDARATLAALEADALELTRLHDERAAQLEELRASSSRDFARMAEIEGQRAALETMLRDQEGEVGRARDTLAVLEAGADRDAKLRRIGELSRTIAASRLGVHAQITTLREELAALLRRVLAVDHPSEANAAHVEWVHLAGQLTGKSMMRYGGDEQAANALYAELEERGVDTLPLRWPRRGYELQGHREPERLPIPASDDPLISRLWNLASEVFGQGRDAMLRAESGEPDPAHVGWAPSVSPTPLPSIVTAGAPAEQTTGEPGVVRAFDGLRLEGGQ